MALCLRRAGSGLGLPGLPESLCTTRHSSVDLEKQVEPSLGPRGMAAGGTTQSIVSQPFSKVRDGPDRPVPRGLGCVEQCLVIRSDHNPRPALTGEPGLPPESDIPEWLGNPEGTPDPAYREKSGRASWRRGCQS